MDVMRVMLFYGLDHISAMVENRPCLNKKANDSVRKLLKEIVECSAGERESDLLKSDEATSTEYHEASSSATRADWHCPKYTLLTTCHKLFKLHVSHMCKLNNEFAFFIWLAATF